MRLMESRLSYDGLFFFDRINYMNSKNGHGRFNTFYGRFMTVRPFFWENRVW